MAQQRAFEAALFALVASGVVFFGGVHPFFQAAHLVAAVALALAFLGASAASGRLVLALPSLAVPLGLALVWGLVQAEGGLSIAPERTREALLRYGTAALVFLLGSTLASSARHGDRRLATGIAVLVAAEALYGLAEHLGGRERILLWPKTYPGWLTGTYVNRNHFAGMLAVGTPIALALALGQESVWDRSVPSLRTRIALATGRPGFWRTLLLGGAAFLGALATCASLSRGGTLALVSGLVVFGILAAPAGGGRRRGLSLVAFAVVATLGVLAFGVGPLVSRFSDLPRDATASVSRLAFVRGTLALVAERPLGGWGLGTFELAYPRVQDGSMTALVLDHAHCDALEFPCELGVPLVALALVWAAWSATGAVRRAEGSRSLLARGLVAGLAAAAVHALVDFDLQLEGSLVLVACVLGLLVGPSARRLELEGTRARLGSVALALGLVALLPYPVRVFRAERLAEPTVRQQDDDRQPGERVADLERAIALRPNVARYRLAVVVPRLEAAAIALHHAALQSATRLVGAHPSEQLVASLERNLREAHADEWTALVARCAQDLRAARASEPSNARVLARLALVTADRAEAFELASEATRAFPFGADVLVDAALARLRFDPADARGREELAHGLALEPALVPEATLRALLVGLARELSRALPTVDAHRQLAAALLERGSTDELGVELDALACAEEGASPGMPSVAPATATPLERVRPEDWRARENGPSLERPDALVLPLQGRRAFAKVEHAGTLLVEASLVPLHSPAFVCVRAGGRHLGHALIADRWRTVAFPLSSAGWVEVVDAVEGHGLRGTSEGSVLIRDVAVVGSAP